QLRQPAGSVTDIAHRCGFFDSAHFVRAWRRACSMAPSAYRDLAVVAPPAVRVTRIQTTF
ncbi:MAG: helix-turn-helix domain-containing protein, partial [Polyangiaceae bacterium]